MNAAVYMPVTWLGQVYKLRCCWISWLGPISTLARIVCWSALGPGVVLAETFLSGGLKKRGPYIQMMTQCHSELAFSRGFLWKNEFCAGFLFRVMYSVDTFLRRAIFFIIFKKKIIDLYLWPNEEEEPEVANSDPGGLPLVTSGEVNISLLYGKQRRFNPDTFCLFK